MPTGSGPQASPNQDETAAGGPERSSLEARLLRRLLSSLGDPPIEFHLVWSGEHVAPTGVRRPSGCESQTAAPYGACCGTLRYASAMRTAQARSKSKAIWSGSWRRYFRALNRPSARETIAARVAGWLPPPSPQLPRRIARQHPPALRFGQQLLFVVARRDHGLHLRLLPERRRDPRAGAGRQDGARMPQAANRGERSRR